MARGFLAGTFWGGLVGAGMLFVSSQAIERQSLSLPQPATAAVEVPGGSEFDQAKEETDTVLPDAETRPASEAIEAVEAPGDAVETPPSFETSALEVPTPSVGQAGDLTDAPAASDAPDAPAASDAARPDDSTGDLVVPDAPGVAPDTNDDAPSAAAALADNDENADAPLAEDTAPSETVVTSLPDADEDQAALSGTTAVPSVDSDATAPTGLTAPSVGEEPTLPSAADTETDAPRLPGLTEPEAPEGVETAPDIASAPQAPAVPALGTGTDADTTLPDIAVVEDQGTIVFEVSPQQDTQVEDAVESAVEEALADAGDAVDLVENDAEPRALPTVRRLGGENSPEPEAELDTDQPVEGDAPIVNENVVTENDAPAADAELAEGVAPAIQAFGTAFENADGTPLMSLVLVQTGSDALTQDQLDGLPVSVAMALDASGAGASQLAGAYRSAGREVVLIPSLPQGATPQDVEQALQVNFDAIPEAVALMDASGSSFQSDRAAVQQIVDVVTNSGHGLITFPRGLNTAHQSATRAGVPTGLIFRRLDDGGETQDQIRRTLDRAAFRARQDQAVILVGTTSPATMAAIVEWSTGNRAASVTLAPISAALLNN